MKADECVERVALVTGAGRGIGRAIAARLAASGAELVLLGRAQDRLDDVAAEIRSAGGHASTFVADLSIPSALPSILNVVAPNLAAQFAGSKVTINVYRPGCDTAMQEQSVSALIPRIASDETGRIWDAARESADADASVVAS